MPRNDLDHSDSDSLAVKSDSLAVKSNSLAVKSNSLAVKSSYLATLETLLLAHGLETWAPMGEVGIARGAVAVALPYDPRPVQGPAATDLPGGPEPYLRVAAFASAHRYAALTRMLKSLAKELAAVSGHPYTAFRVAVNSRLPEKQLVQLSGLGYGGKSDLLLTHAYGPACILGLLLLPFDPLEAPTAGPPIIRLPEPVGLGLCSTCQACADACPGKAITGLFDRDVSRSASNDTCSGNGTYHREACIQHWMSAMDEPSPALRPAFAGHLYGCDACILACPLSAGAWLPDRADGSSPASRAEALLLPGERRPGTFISASFLAAAGDDELKSFFRKTALGLSWFGPGMLRHNAALASHDS